MFRRLMNLPLTVASRAAKAFQDREDEKTKQKYGTAYDPASVPVGAPEAAHATSAAAGDAGEHGLSVEAVRALIGKQPLAFVDVRDAASWAAGHVRLAAHMPMAELNVRVSELPWDQHVVAYCDDGALSAQAVAFFRERGMEDTFFLQGGLAAWRAAGGEVAR